MSTSATASTCSRSSLDRTGAASYTRGYGPPMRRGVAAAFVAAFALVAAAPADASPGARYGIQDDAWLLYGPGALSDRLTTLDDLGVQVVRFALRWDQVAPTRPARPRSSEDPAYRWGAYG